MPPVNRGAPSTRAPLASWAPVALLAALAFWVRARGLPGTWGSDSLTYFEACRAADPLSTDPRADRWLAVALVRGALRLGGWAPAAASVPGVLLSAAVVPVLWIALRRRLGDALALLPCAIWAFLGLALEEVVEISSDVMTVLPAAAAVLGLLAAAQRTERRLGPLAGAGLALGVGATLKETTLFATVGFAAGAFTIGRGAARWRHAAAVALPALAVFGLGVLLVNPRRLGNASEYMAWDPAFVPVGAAAYLRRMTIEIPMSLLTATQAYGLLFVVAIPLCVRLPFRAMRGDPLAVASLAGLLAFDVVPISLSTWSLLPATRPRYLLCLMPLFLAAITDALRERPTSQAERWASLAAAALGFRFVGESPWTLIVVPIGLLVTAWPALPDPIGSSIPQRRRLSLSAALLVAATVAWARLPAGPTSGEWAVAGVVGALVTTPWLVGRDRGDPFPYFAVGASLVLAVAMTRSRFVRDDGWTAWSHLPPSGRVFAERIVGRRLRAASTAAGADASRVVLLDETAAPPSDLGPTDRVLVRDVGSLAHGLRLADACRAPGSGLREVPARLGDTVIFARAPR
jgi:hypothetical protein